MPRTFLLILLGIAAGTVAPSAFAQTDGGVYGADALTSQRRTARLTIQPLYQSYTNSPDELREWSLPVRLTVPLGDRWQVRLQGSAASVQREEGASVRGLADARAGLSYARDIGESSVIVSANANIPTGTETLSPEAFETTTVLSQKIYDFRVTGLGQGLGVSTGATWVVPLSDNLALGLGGSYQVQGSYMPIADMAESYDPGSRTLVTGGLEYRLTRTTALSANGSLWIYGSDTVGGAERFDPGPKGSVELQFVRERGYSTLRLRARYEGRGASTQPTTSGTAFNQQVFPSQGLFQGQYETRLTDAIDFAVSASGRTFGETVAHDRETIGVARVRLSIEVGGGLVLAPETAYTNGTFSGIEGGLTVGWTP
jgi:hypothetical protein